MAAPVLDQIDNISYPIGTSFRIALSASDADGDTLTFSADTLPNGVNLTDGVIQGVFLEYGTTVSRITVSDGTSTDFQDVTFISRNYGEATESVTYSPPSGITYVTLSGTIQTNNQFTVQPVAGDQIAFTSGDVNISQQLAISGNTGTHEIWHVEQDGTVHKIDYLISSITTTVTFSAGSEYTTATIASGYDPYVFQNWDESDITGYQLTTLTADGYFDAGGNYYSNVEHVHPVWVTDLNGLVTRITLDSTLIGSQIDTTPNAFTFTDLTNQSLLVTVESNAIEITGVTSGQNIPVTVSGGEYAVSTDGGQSYGAWTTSETNVQLGYFVKLRATTSADYSASLSVTFNANGVSDTWTITTLAADQTPDAFVFNDLLAQPVSTITESNEITVTGISTGISVSVAVTGGEYAISTDGGQSYGSWTSTAGQVSLNNRVKVRHSTSSSFTTQVSTTLTLAGVVSDVFTTTTQAQSIDSTPDAFTFNDLIGQELNTQLESNPVTVQGLEAGQNIAISINGGEYAISTDGGQTYSAFTSSAGTIANGSLLKLRITTSASFASRVNCVVTVGTYSVTWSVVTKTSAIDQFFIYDPEVILDRFYGNPYRVNVVKGSSNWVGMILYNDGVIVNLSNITDLKIELEDKDGNTYSDSIVNNPAIFSFEASEGKVQARLGQIDAPVNTYYMSVIYYDASHVNGAHMTANRKIVVTLE